MAYSDFTLREIEQRFHLAIVEDPDLFHDVPEARPTPRFQELLRVHTPLALAINTEKARSELLIAPILVEVRELVRHRASLFSGVDFSVDPASGLNGTCDFLLTRSPQQQFVHAPVVTVVEAKNDNLKCGFGQCVAAMVGARLFNEREGGAISAVFGAVTTGTLWRFLRLAGDAVTLDQREYHIERVAKVLGILVHAVTGAGEPAAV